MYRLTKGSIAAAALAAAAMIGPQQATAQDGHTICFVTFSLQIACFQSSVSGGERAAEELGVDRGPWRVWR